MYTKLIQWLLSADKKSFAWTQQISTCPRALCAGPAEIPRACSTECTQPNSTQQTRSHMLRMDIVSLAVCVHWTFSTVILLGGLIQRCTDSSYLFNIVGSVVPGDAAANSANVHQTPSRRARRTRLLGIRGILSTWNA